MPKPRPDIKRETFELNACDNSPGPRAQCYTASVQVELPGGTLLECLDHTKAAALAATINAMVTHVHSPVSAGIRRK